MKFLKFALFAALAVFALPSASQAEEIQLIGNDPVLKKNIEEGQKAVNDWLLLIDSGQYGKSWQAGSLTFRLTIKEKEWEKAMQEVHKAYGSIVSRKILDIRTAKDPQNLPKGDYLVYFYKSDFSIKHDAYELLTLIQETDGTWRILTYEVK